MFKLYTRIAEDAENLRELKQIKPDLFDKEYHNISGYIEIKLEKSGCIGFYHDEPLREEELGYEWLNWWLEKLADILWHLPKTKYIAFNELETHTWLELTHIDENVVLLKKAERSVESDGRMFTSARNIDFIYEPHEYRFSYEEMKLEVISATERFFDELAEINEELLQTNMAKKLFEKINRIREL